MGKIDFLKTFIKDKDVASITPTSMHCVRKVCTNIDFSQDFTLVEYGPGDGVFTRYLLEKMSAGSRLILIEANADFVEQLRVTIHDSRVEIHNILAGDVESVIPAEHRGKIDYVLSGIPFSVLKTDLKSKVLHAARSILIPCVLFLADKITGHLKKPVMEVFGNYETDFVPLNIPPYFIYKVFNNVSTTDK